MKFLSLTVAFLLVGLFASAQVLPSFQLGIKAGANFSKFDSENTFNSNNRAGFYVERERSSAVLPLKYSLR